MCFELAAFFVAYAATFSFAPALTQIVRDMMASPPLMLPLFSIVAIYFAVSRSVRAALLFLFPSIQTPRIEGLLREPQSHVSLGLGAIMGVLRGAIVVAGIAMIGCSFVRIQDRSREHWLAQGELTYCDPGNQGAGGFDLDAVAAVH